MIEIKHFICRNLSNLHNAITDTELSQKEGYITA